MISAPVDAHVLQGSQLPRVSAVPEYASSTGDEAIELAAMAGLNLLPWQQWVLRHSLGERADGKWAAFEAGLVVGRQNGKNAVLEARELAELFLVAPMTGPRTIIHSAHKFSTSLEHFRRIKRRVLDTPELVRRVKGPLRRGTPAGIRDSHGEESIELKDGSRLIFQARTSSGGQGAGFTADLLIWDEAWNLPDSVIGFVLPTLSAKTMEVPGVQVWYTSQAVNQQTMPYGVHLARIRERGTRGDEPDLFFAEWSVDEDEFSRHPELADDPLALAQANPSLGYLIALEHVRRERAGAMPWYEYLAHRLGVGDWPPTDEADGRAISPDAWRATAEIDASKRIAGRKFFAVDTSPDHAWGAVGVAGARQDDLFHVATVRHERGTDWIVAECGALRDEHPGSRFVIDPGGPAANLIPGLKRLRIPLIETSTRDYADACAGFLDAIVEDTLRHPAMSDLDAAVPLARKQKMGDRWKWSRQDGDVSSLVAATLAHWAAACRDGMAEVICFDDLDDDGVKDDLLAPDVAVVPIGTVAPQDLLVDTFDPEALEPVLRGAGRLLKDAAGEYVDVDDYYVLRVESGSPQAVAQAIRGHARILGALKDHLQEGMSHDDHVHGFAGAVVDTGESVQSTVRANTTIETHNGVRSIRVAR